MEPDRLEKRYRERRSATATQQEEEQLTSSLTDDYDQDDDKGTTPLKRKERRSKREAPYIIYPEILVIVDYDGYRLHGGDNLQVGFLPISMKNFLVQIPERIM